MAMDQVLSDQDSEDEVGDDVADLEDRRVGHHLFNDQIGIRLYMVYD